VKNDTTRIQANKNRNNPPPWKVSGRSYKPTDVIHLKSIILSDGLSVKQL